MAPVRLEEIERLARMAGTPLLVVDLTVVAERFAELTQALPRAEVHYAVKANDEAPILRLLNTLGAGFEISSEAELNVLESLGIGADHVVSSNPVKTPAFIRAAWEAGVHNFAFDSTDEADKLAALAPGSDVYVRLTVPNDGSEWPLSRKFGVDLADAVRCLAYAKDRGLHPCGLAFHVGSQNVEPSAWVTAIEVASHAWEAAEAEGIPMSVLNIGGGFPVPYTRPVPPLTRFAAALERTISRLFPPSTKVVTEPGRFLVGEAGVLASSVVAKAQREEESWLYLDVGVFNGLMEALGGIKYQLVASRPGPSRRWVLAGPSCDSFDVISSGAELPEVQVGDIVLLLSAGAYTTVYGSSFNGFRPPKVHFLE